MRDSPDTRVSLGCKSCPWFLNLNPIDTLELGSHTLVSIFVVGLEDLSLSVTLLFVHSHLLLAC